MREIAKGNVEMKTLLVAVPVCLLIAASTNVFAMSRSKPSEGKTPFLGSWASTQKDCKDPNDGNIRITEKNFYGHEQGCDINKISNTPNGLSFDLSCGGEGETWDETR